MLEKKEHNYVAMPLTCGPALTGLCPVCAGLCVPWRVLVQLELLQFAETLHLMTHKITGTVNLVDECQRATHCEILRHVDDIWPENVLKLKYFKGVGVDREQQND